MCTHKCAVDYACSIRMTLELYERKYSWSLPSESLLTQSMQWEKQKTKIEHEVKRSVSQTQLCSQSSHDQVGWATLIIGWARNKSIPPPPTIMVTLIIYSGWSHSPCTQLANYSRMVAKSGSTTKRHQNKFDKLLLYVCQFILLMFGC